MIDNVKKYSKICSRIGWAMLIFYSLFTLSTAGVALLQGIVSAITSNFAIEAIFEVALAIVYFLSFVIPAFILCKMAKRVHGAKPIFKSCKLNGSIILIVIAIIAINFTISYLNATMVTSLFPSLASKFDLLMDSNLDDRPFYQIIILFIISIFSTAIVPAICEEYLFRGAILTNLLPYGKTVAIVGSAFLFGLMHQNPLQLLYTTLMGVAIGYVYVKTKSIWACMIIHFTNNLVAVVEEYLTALTKIDWIVSAVDLGVVLLGGLAVLILILKKDKEKRIDENGSFGVVFERGMDVEEYPLELTNGKKVRRFFSATIIIFTIIAVFSMGQILLVYFLV